MSTMTEEQTKARIRKLNDLARTAMGVASVVNQTEGIRALDPADQSPIREKVEKFNTFTEGNDPHHEHDFEIDYYDRDLEYGSEHAEDPGQTKRVLTIMLAEEY